MARISGSRGSAPSTLREEVNMPKFAKDTQSTVISCLRYRDAPAAIEWLRNTFGEYSGPT
jgi:hypothetical protein